MRPTKSQDGAAKIGEGPGRRAQASPPPWLQVVPAHDETDPDASGALTPLDRLAQIVEATGDVDLDNWLATRPAVLVPAPMWTIATCAPIC